MWYKREISTIWDHHAAQPVRILVGPRQSGKSSFLEHYAEPERSLTTFDDLATRELAATDPRAFLDSLPSKVVIDEAQYVPDLFPELKRRVDVVKRAKRESTGAPQDFSVWLTGSNRVLLDREVAESLTGRATYYRFHNMAAFEIKENLGSFQFRDYLLRGGWPELYANKDLDSVSYLNDHIQTTLEKDLVRTAGITKVNEFLRVLRLAAGRIGGLFVASEIARDAGVKSETVSDWISFTERMMYLIEVPAYSTSLSTRLIKAPKYYFSDIAIATRLQGWTSPEPILVSPYLGFLFENAVVTEVVKIRDCHLADWQLAHWRTKEKEEVDLIITANGRTLALECKYAGTEIADLKFPQQVERIPGVQLAMASLYGGPDKPNIRHIALADLKDFLVETFDLRA